MPAHAPKISEIPKKSYTFASQSSSVEQVEEHLVGPKKLSRVQLDALWTYVGHKGEKGGSQKKKHAGRIARGTAIDMDSRLRVGRAIAKTEEEVAPQLMQQIKRHAPQDPPPAMSTDGKGPIEKPC
jgi:hypothetical protein